ncbi:MAG: enoyl-CoA hydratase/isomerase family protein [Salinirussus sp.]
MVNAAFAVEEEVGYITIQREEALNAIDTPTKLEIIDRLEAYRVDDDVRAVVFQSEGDQAFTAGGDLDEVIDVDFDLSYHTETWDELFTSMMRLGKPTIAKVDGWALGGGFDLLLHTDIVIAADDAMIGQPEIGLGILNHFSPAMLPSLVGLRTTMELLLTGDPITGERAANVGLVTRAVPADELDDEIEDVLDSIRSNPARITKHVKDAIWASIDMSPSAARAHIEARSLDSARTEPYYEEGVRAQREDREPDWDLQ